MRAVVTGGAGFIGSHVVEALLERGDEVHVLDDLSKGTRERVAAGAELHVADIRDPDAVFDGSPAGRGLPPRRPGGRARLGRAPGPRRRRERARDGADPRGRPAARAPRSIFASTGGAVYGECTGPAGESAERRPLAPYGTSKLCGEEYLATWNRLYGTRARLAAVRERLRPAPGAARRGGRRRDLHGAPARAAARRRSTATAARRATTCSSRTSYARCSPRSSRAGGVFNVGTGVETSVVELYDAIQRVSGVTREPAFAEARLGELQRSVLDISLAERELGWRPEHSLDDGLARTWAWVREE